MVVKDENDFEISEFYRLWIFEKVEKLMFFLIFSRFSKIFKIKKEKIREEKRGPLLQVDGLPLVAIPKQ